RLQPRALHGPAQSIQGVFVCPLVQRVKITRQIRKFLRYPIVQLAGDSLPLRQRRYRRQRTPVGPDFPDGTNEQDRVEQTPERVATVQRLRVHGRQQVIDLGRRRQDGGDGKPAEKLVTAPPRAPQEPDGGQAVQYRPRELQ